MSEPFYLNFGNLRFYLDTPVPTYFGLHKGYLDIYTMKYRIFGAVWKIVNEKRYVLGFWFADSEKEIHRAIKEAGFNTTIEMKSQKNVLNEIYQLIRIEQDKKNWSKRRMLKVISIMRKPLKDLRKGWYVLKSSNNFPMVLTCIQKKQFAIWIEHIQICETQEDIKKFINLVNLEHNIKLSPEPISFFQY
ncbi:hypothetical protein [Bacillus sp. OTU2372]|uniref:hypothetical protein n=1 Tax=Bacillus sp. OTU2372 TaxID=3043858 RepID=UPI00313D13D2